MHPNHPKNRNEPKRRTCADCNYTWIPRKENPKKCPFCQSLYWVSGKVATWTPVEANDAPGQPKTCQNCGYSWTPRTANPKKCPGCGSAHWNFIKRGKSKSQKTDSEPISEPPFQSGLKWLQF